MDKNSEIKHELISEIKHELEKNQFTDEIRQKKVLKISKIAITSLI